MAMSLLDAGMRADRFCIDAVDISVRALAQARLGVYRANAFRGVRADIRDRYFTKTVDGHRVNEAVRRQVQFHHGNLLAAEAFLVFGVLERGGVVVAVCVDDEHGAGGVRARGGQHGFAFKGHFAQGRVIKYGHGNSQGDDGDHAEFVDGVVQNAVPYAGDGVDGDFAVVRVRHVFKPPWVEPGGFRRFRNFPRS